MGHPGWVRSSGSRIRKRKNWPMLSLSEAFYQRGLTQLDEACSHVYPWTRKAVLTRSEALAEIQPARPHNETLRTRTSHYIT